jgi:hypothetical protein
MIKPEDKRADERMEIALPAAYLERVRTHAKDLDDSTPEYVVRAIVMDYFDAGHNQETGSGAKPKTERPARPKEAKSKPVAMPTEREKAVA